MKKGRKVLSLIILLTLIISSVSNVFALSEVRLNYDVAKHQKADLTAYKAALSAVKRSDYTKESWSVYQKVVLKNKVNPNDTQERVDEATQAIIDAQSKLVKKEQLVDKTLLVAKIEEAQLLNEEDYTQESWEDLQEALAEAIEVNEDANATQEQVDEALEELEEAIDDLEENPEEPIVDKTLLVAKIEEAQLLNEEDYTQESWEDLQEALTEAIEVNEDANATQEQVDEALEELEEAIGDLEENPEKPIVDKTLLVAKIAEAQLLNEVDYTPESWVVLQVALTEAIRVNDDVNATQGQVDVALVALTEAITALIPVAEPQISATFHPQMMIPTFGKIFVEVGNIEGAAKFNVTYHLAPKDGNEVIASTKIIDIGTPIATTGYPNIFYNPATTGFDTIVVNVFDAAENLIYTFEGVVPVRAQ